MGQNGILRLFLNYNQLLKICDFIRAAHRERSGKEDREDRKQLVGGVTNLELLCLLLTIITTRTKAFGHFSLLCFVAARRSSVFFFYTPLSSIFNIFGVKIHKRMHGCQYTTLKSQRDGKEVEKSYDNNRFFFLRYQF